MFWVDVPQKIARRHYSIETNYDFEEAMKELEKLDHLPRIFWRAEISAKNVERFCQVVKKQEYAKYFVFSSQSICPEVVFAMVDIITRNRLVYLDFSNNNIGNECVIALAKAKTNCNAIFGWSPIIRISNIFESLLLTTFR